MNWSSLQKKIMPDQLELMRCLILFFITDIKDDRTVLVLKRITNK